ncbi:unnamed protein product [Porites evermanni]|uniref:Uncharacterized protein n=1 Tax=Porites evermanni TaxID=104178 RepID=A0ABN8LYJ8_9CNID|nr:unnamed protein product [Porites evermanni]
MGVVTNVTWFVLKIRDHPIDEWRYFPYRATFDFECYFDKEKAQELKNTEKLTWQSAHVPLSVSVCSNVPGYQAPKCFVLEGDSDLLLEAFVQYLTKISTKRNVESGEDENSEEEREDDSRGIDLRASDDKEDEKGIEAENEEDHSLKFRDISNYFAPGFSYDQFPESVRVRTDQGIFPISVARQVGQARRNIAAPTRCLLLKSDER